MKIRVVLIVVFLAFFASQTYLASAAKIYWGVSGGADGGLFRAAPGVFSQKT